MHFSQLQNKPVELDCVQDTCLNRVFFNAEHRMALDFGSATQKMFQLENSLQIQVNAGKERSVEEVAQILREFADVHV